MNPISATLTRCRHGQPLVELTSQPFNGLEIRPKDLRNMAHQLLALAETAARMPTGGKHFAPTRIDLGTARQAPIATPEPLPRQPKPTHCTFCSTPAADASHLVEGPGVAICNDCITCASDIVITRNKSGCKKKLNERIGKVVLESGLTQADFSAETGIALERLKNLVGGRVQRLKPEEAQAIQSRFGYRDTWLREGKGTQRLTKDEAAQVGVPK